MDGGANGLALLQCYSDSEDDNQVEECFMATTEDAALNISSPTPNEKPILLTDFPTSDLCQTQTDQESTLDVNNKPTTEISCSTSNIPIEIHSAGIDEEVTCFSSATNNQCGLKLEEISQVSLQTPSEPIEKSELLPAGQFSLAYREVESSSESSSDSDSSSDESICVPIGGALIDNEDDEEETTRKADSRSRQVNPTSKMLEDLGILDLAPLEDLKITVEEAECIPIGTIHNIIDMLVIVMARKGCPAIDLDSVLFLDQGKKILGQVFDVFGPVNEPMYMIRFNSAQHVLEQGVQVGLEVFYAPRTKHTAYVFIDALFKQKGSDASWLDDQEPPENCLDYSDDEEERRAKAAHRLKKKQLDPDIGDPDQKEPGGESRPPPRRAFRRNNNPRPHNPHQMHRGGHHQPRHPANPFYMRPPPPNFLPQYPPPFQPNPQNGPMGSFPYCYPPPPPPPPPNP